MTEPFTEITLDYNDDVATLTLNRPEALNAITPTMLGELNRALTDISAQPSTRFVILTGAGRAFSAGVDLKALGDILDVPARRVIAQIEALPQPVIARVNGFCFTGALELALACDLMIAADKARIGDTHAKWGLRPTWGMSQRLPMRVGIAKARELSLTARTLTGADAVALGLANQVVPLDELDEAIATLIGEMRPNSAESFVAYKDLYRQAENRSQAAGLHYEATTDYAFTDSGERLAEFRK